MGLLIFGYKLGLDQSGSAAFCKQTIRNAAHYYGRH